MKILYLADPSSIHDQKWILFFKGSIELHLIRRSIHQQIPEEFSDIIHDHGTINDFSILRPLRTINSLIKLKRIVSRQKIDLFHIYYAEPNSLWAITSKILGVPIVLTTRGSDILLTIRNHFTENSFQNYYVRRLYRMAINNCMSINCTSANQKATIKELFDPKSEPMVIRTGVDISALRNFTLKDVPSVLQNKRFVLMPRAMRSLYNHEFTLSAISKVKRTIKDNFVFVFLDSDSADLQYVNKIKGIISSIEDCHFEFLPKQSQKQLYSLYQAAQLVVMNPKSDGSPVSGLEAMLFNCPLILGPILYDSDLFGDWVMKLKSWDPIELAELIDYGLHMFPDEKLDIAKKRVLELGDRNVEMSRLRAVYHSLIS